MSTITATPASPARPMHPFLVLLAIGLVTLLVGQSALNLAVAFRMAPVTGLTLPFVSYGGSSLVVSFIGVGMLLSISRDRHGGGSKGGRGESDH